MRHLSFVLIALTAAAPVAAEQADRSAWFGTWSLRLADPADKPETLIYSDAGGGAMRMVSVEDGRELITHFDGKPSVDVRAGPGPAPTLAIRATSPTSYTWTFARPAKPDVQGRNALAADRRSFTEVSWLVTEPAKTVTLVYDRR